MTPLNVWRDPAEYCQNRNQKPRLLVVGNFDGVHLGHQTLIHTCLERAEQKKIPALLLTFDPHPRSVLDPQTRIPLLTPLNEKLEFLAACGIEDCLVYPFDSGTAQMEGESFVRDVFCHQLGAREVFIGFNFALGRGGRCRAEQLQSLGEKLGFDVNIMSGLRLNGNLVSSTNIRLLITAGNVEEATAFLGRPPSLQGTVITGNRLGRMLGCPTANISPEERVLPKPGVYIGEVRYDEVLHPAVINIGYRPTLPTTPTGPLVEAHLLDFEGNLYGEMLTIRFLRRMRDEIRFANFDTLGETIGRDVETARLFFRRRSLGKDSN